MISFTTIFSTAIFSQALEILLPFHCLICNRRIRGRNLCYRCLPPRYTPAGQFRCVRCYSSALELDTSAICALCRLYPPVFEHLRFLWIYDQPARELINIMKYRPSPALCKTSAAVLGQAIDSLFCIKDWDLVVPVPASRQSLASRTFNQCNILASAILKRPGNTSRMHIARSLLTHNGYKHVQASLEHHRRISNVKGAFNAGKNLGLEGRKILLVDDVLTTGATSTAAGLELLRAGAQSVDLVALARAEAWQEYRYEIHSSFSS